ncbi:MAG: site-specific DNA-methyltransferase, partial [Holophagaceae bacterium]|nr:site-specific DNA-methyltransferase [Holophagaceae bacterium]
YPRLRVARDLLRDDGVIFISIDDNEVENLKKICNEVFGEGNFVAELVWKSKSGGANDSRFFAIDHEFVCVYAKNANHFSLLLDTEATVTTSYNQIDEIGRYSLDRLDKQSIRYSQSLDYEIKDNDGNSYFPKHKNPKRPNATWRWSRETVAKRYSELVFKDGNIYTKNYEKDGAIARSLLLEDRFGRTRTGKTDMFELFNIELFSNPKPFKLVRHLAMITSSPDSIILDFFSGSATTAHAVMQLNAEDGGRRRFIMVQLPEVCDEKSEAAKAGYKNICEIGKERIRRAGEKIVAKTVATKQGHLPLGTEAPHSLDTGFRVLKLDSSNMKDVYYTPQEYVNLDMFGLVDNIKEDRTAEDLLFQVMLDLGIPLSAKIEVRQIDGVTVHYVEGDYLAACFDAVTDGIVTKIAQSRPKYAVFRDSSFASDSTLVNFEQIFKTYSPETIRKVL